MNWSPNLAASISADLTKSIKPGRQPLPTSETKCSRIKRGRSEPSAGATHRLPRTYATSFLMSNGAFERRPNSNDTASLEYINCLCSTDPAAILDSTQAASYIYHGASCENVYEGHFITIITKYTFFNTRWSLLRHLIRAATTLSANAAHFRYNNLMLQFLVNKSEWVKLACNSISRNQNSICCVSIASHKIT